MIVLFDLNGTLTDPAAIGAPWDAPDLGPAVLDTAVRSAMVDALTGEVRPLAEHLRAAIAFHVETRGLDPGRIDEAAERARALPAWPDAADALTTLAEAGHRLAVLTNSGADSGRRTLEAAGLAERFEAILGVDAVDTFKPHPSTYRHAVQALDAAPGAVTLVAAHGWDVTGAKRAGLRTCLIARGGEPLLATTAPPDHLATSLAHAAAQLAG